MQDKVSQQASASFTHHFPDLKSLLSGFGFLSAYSSRHAALLSNSGAMLVQRAGRLAVGHARR